MKVLVQIRLTCALILGALLLLVTPALAEPLTLFYTGEVGGLASSYDYQMRTPYQLMARFVRERGEAEGWRDFNVSRTAIYFYSDQHYIWGADFGVRELRAFLKAHPEPIQRETVSLLQSHDSLILASAAATELIQQLSGYVATQPEFQTRIRLQEGELLTYPGGVQMLQLPRATERSDNPLNWEMLLGFDMQLHAQSGAAQAVQIIGKPLGEGTRRMRLLQELRGPDDLLVDAGNLLEGLSSVVTNSLSLQRKNSLQMVQALNYFALNVGQSELRGGLSNLLREQQAYHLPLISASLLQKGNYVFEPYKIVSVGTHKAALVGVTGAAALKRLQELGDLDSSLEVLEPNVALERVVKELKSEHKADLIILLANLDPAALRDLVDQSHELHLILGNTDTPLQHLKESVQLDSLEKPHPFLAYTNPDAVNLVQVNPEREGLSISNEMIPVHFDLQPEAQFLPKILEIRQRVYEDALETLIPNLGPEIRKDPELLELFLNSRVTQAAARQLGGFRPLSQDRLLELYPPFMTAEMLANLEMNGLMEAFNAEVVVFKHSAAMNLNVPGALPRLLVYEGLKMGDTLEMYYLNGTQLKSLLDLPQADLIFGGVSADHLKVWGRPLGDRRTVYRVLMPSGVSSLSGVREIVSTVRQQEHLDNPFATAGTAHKDQPLYLRNTILAFLDQLQQQPHYRDQLLKLMKQRWNQKQLLFSLQLNNFQLNLSGYNALNNDEYSEVRETRVISPSSLTFGGKSDFSLGWDNEFFGFSNSVQAKYEGLSVLETKPDASAQKRFTENQDDLVFSSELEMRFFEFPLFDTQIALVPFLEGIYDTEFTPTVNQDTQALNPRQSEVRGVLGLSIPAGTQLKKFKTGFALRRDFNVPNNLEAGFDLKFVHELPINTALKWSNDLDGRYFLPSPNDNASSLALIAQWVSSLNVSLTENLTLRFFADSYFFQGKLPSNSDPGASVILGVGLGYDRVWKPFYEPLF